MVCRDDSRQSVWRSILDPGWLFLVAGLALIASAVLIPAQDARAEARWQRDRAVALQDHRTERLTRYERYLDAIHAGGETIARSLAASQLNLVPQGHATLRVAPGRRDASVFGALEPPPLKLPSRRASDSRLRQLTVNPDTRPWVLASGIFAVLIGLLPVARATTLVTMHEDEVDDDEQDDGDEADADEDEWDENEPDVRWADDEP